MEEICSKENQLIKEVKKLKEKKFRDRNEEFIVEGFRLCTEALESQYEVKHVFLSENYVQRWENFHMEEKLQKSSKVYKVADNIVRSMCNTENPQGIAAVVKKKNIPLENKDGFYVLADKIQDPGNMGTIIRSAHACGALGVIITKGTVDIYNDKTIRSTMGSIFHIPIIEDDNLKSINSIKKFGFKLIVSSLDAENNFYDEDIRGNVIISVGNEGNGISPEVMALGDIKVKIPMPGGAESLNAAVSASIMMYESLRQRQIKK